MAKWCVLAVIGLLLVVIGVREDGVKELLAVEDGYRESTESWAGVLSPLMFRRHVVAPATRIVAALRSRYPTVPVIGFPRLSGTLLRIYAESGVQGIGIDTATDPALAAQLVPKEIALQGNLDPVALLAGGPTLEAETRSILEAMRGRPHVFNLGHGILPPTPPEHVAALVKLVRQG